MKSKNLVIIGILILILAIAINESRFIIWGPFGVPEKPNSMNCGEDRYDFKLRINSKDNFLNFIKSFENRSINIYEGMPAEDRSREYIIQWVKGGNFTLNDVNVRNSGSLLFSQKIYSVGIPGCKSSLFFEISENGYASVIGCCGI
jgi:hypothetical protein